MNVYKMDNEKLQKVASDFNNTMYGRRIWLYSKAPEIIGFISLVLYFVLTIYGAKNPELRDTISFFILADIIVIGLSLLLYGFAGVMYWKQVSKYANEVEKEENAKKKEEVVVSHKKTVKKISTKPKKSTTTKSKK